MFEQSFLLFFYKAVYGCELLELEYPLAEWKDSSLWLTSGKVDGLSCARHFVNRGFVKSRCSDLKRRWRDSFHHGAFMFSIHNFAVIIFLSN